MSQPIKSRINRNKAFVSNTMRQVKGDKHKGSYRDPPNSVCMQTLSWEKLLTTENSPKRWSDHMVHIQICSQWPSGLFIKLLSHAVVSCVPPCGTWGPAASSVAAPTPLCSVLTRVLMLFILLYDFQLNVDWNILKLVVTCNFFFLYPATSDLSHGLQDNRL